MGSWMSEASSSVAGSMRSPLSSFMRSPMTATNSAMPSPVSSRLTLEFETAFLMEAEEPVRFSSTDILPYLSQPSSRSASSSEFSSGEDDEDHSRSTSFCDFNDSHRITLGNLIGLPMDSFRYVGESFRLRMGSSTTAGSSARHEDSSPRRSRTCSLLGDLFRCLQQRTKTDYTVPTSITSHASFTITEVPSEEERGTGSSESSDSLGPTVFDNSVFMERDTLGSRIYEFNPLYISDAISETSSTAPSRTVSLDHVPDLVTTTTTTSYSTPVETPRLSTQVCRTPPLSPMRSILTTVCCQLGDDSDEYMSE